MNKDQPASILRPSAYSSRFLPLLGALLLAGCTTAPSAKRVGSGSLELNSRDREVADSLAHYSQGLINADEHGANSPQSLHEFARAAELSGGNIAIYMRVADACVANGLRDEAIRILQETIAQSPSTLEAYIKLAALYQLKGNVEETITTYQAAITQHPTRTGLYLNTATLLFHLRQDAEALALLDIGMRTAAQPEKLRSFCHRQGLKYINQRDSERAVGCLLLVAKFSNTQRSYIYGIVGQLQETLGFKQDAAATYLKATQDAAPAPEAFVHLARARYLESDPDAAIEVLRDGVRRLPDSMTLLMALGNTYDMLNHFPEAISVYERLSALIKAASGIPPDHFYLRYGATCDRAGRTSDAAEIFELCLQYYPNDHQVLNYLAYMWAERGLYLDKAMLYVDRALTHAPKSPAYLDTRGWIHYKNGDYRAALEDITLAWSFMPDEPTISDHLGDTWRALGNLEKALAHWKISYRADSDNGTVAEKLQANGIDLEALLPSEAPPRAEPALNREQAAEAETSTLR